MEIKEIQKILNKDFRDYQIIIKEYNNKYYAFLDKEKEFDTPVLWFDKITDEKGAIDSYSKDAFKIFNEGKNIAINHSEDDKDMDYEKIYNLLLKYGASEKEAENFINDLKELPDEAKEELFDEDYNFENWRD